MNATRFRIIVKVVEGMSVEDARAALRRSVDTISLPVCEDDAPGGPVDRPDQGARTSPEIIRLDASRWTTVLDFSDALLPALGAPVGHGKNVNALIDSMVYGEINKLVPPFRVEVRGPSAARLISSGTCVDSGRHP